MVSKSKNDMFIYKIWKSMLTCVITFTKHHIWHITIKNVKYSKMGWNDSVKGLFFRLCAGISLSYFINFLHFARDHTYVWARYLMKIQVQNACKKEYAPSDIISSHYPLLLFHKSWLVFEWIGSNIKFRFNRRGWLLCFQLWVDNGLKWSMEEHDDFF